MDADRNLLFGVLALQGDLIDAERFAEACTAWAARKTKPLAELMVERGWITNDDRAHVEYFLERKLQRHSGDLQASLAAVADNRVLRVLDGVADPDLQKTLDGLAKRVGHVLVSTIAYTSETRDRYALTRLHAKGGIGQVWLARDADLGREVALKELRPDRAADPAIWSRFLEEARITGQLEHPNIVPVHELVKSAAERQPFYTMRFVRGRTLTQAIREYHARRKTNEPDPLGLQSLLTAYIGVCNAVAYAHSRGVIHRDLKGQNVVVGEYGEVVLLDWGLAKLTDRPEAASTQPMQVPIEEGREETLPGQAMGTPAYMAPEQAEGRLDRIDGRTDVYGLGAILYEILAGEPPFEGSDAVTILQKVIAETPAPPRLANPDTPPPLEAVCRKAMAKRPEDRYASVRELASDVQHFLADEPVSAYPEGWSRRLGRWMRRHRSATQTAAAALLAVAAIAVVSAFLINQARDRADRALLAEIRAKAEAQANFEHARRTVDDYLTLVSESVQLRRDLPGLQKFRAELLGKALDYYRTFAAEHEDKPELKAEVAGAYYRTALVNEEIGPKPQALAACLEAFRRIESLARAPGGEDRTRVARARLYWLRGKLEYATGKEDAAIASYTRSTELYRRAIAADARDLACRQGLCDALVGLGLSQATAGHQAEAEAADNEARDVARRALIEWPGNAELLKSLGTADNNLGLVQRNLGRLADAAESFRRARDIDADLAKADPYDGRVRGFLANNYLNLGVTAERLGRIDEAEASLREGIRVLQPLRDRHPDVTLYKQQAANLLESLGNLMMTLNRIDDAGRSYADARDLVAEISAADRANFIVRINLGTLDGNLGLVENRSGRPDRARSFMLRGVATLEELVESHPELALARFEIANGRYNLSFLERVAGKTGEAIVHADRSRSHLDHLLRIGPDVHHYQRLDTQVRVMRSILASASGDVARARDELRPAEKVAARSFSTDAAILYDLACAQAQLGGALCRRSGADSAAKEGAATLDAAIATFSLAIAAGYRDLPNLRADTDLDPLRDRADFNAVIEDAAIPRNPFRVDR